MRAQRPAARWGGWWQKYSQKIPIGGSKSTVTTRSARRYFAGVPALEPPADAPPGSQHAWHLYMLRLHLDQLRIDRAQFIEELKQRHIGASVHFIPLHLHPYYRETYGYRPEDFPVAYREYQREISLPIFSKMSDQDVQDVIDALLEIVAMHGY